MAHWSEIRLKTRTMSPERAADFVLRTAHHAHPVLYSVPVPVTDIAEWVGAEVYEAKLDVSGMVRRDEATGAAAIFVDRGELQTRQRFTIAHELGHLLLHDFDFEMRELAGPGDLARQRTEHEANRFAAALLMPAESLSRHAAGLNYNVRELAALYGVSVSAMSRQLKRELRVG